MFGSHWKWGCRSIFFDMKSFHTDVERYPHNMKWGRKTHGGLAGFSKYPRKNECVWGSTETGLDRATPKHGLWLLLTGTLPSGFYFINFKQQIYYYFTKGVPSTTIGAQFISSKLISPLVDLLSFYILLCSFWVHFHFNI